MGCSGCSASSYIEHELAVGDWQLLINPELLGPLTTSFSTGLVQAMADLRFELDDGLLAFKHGLVPAGPQNKLGYLLDFDYFTQVQNDDTSVESLLKRFDCYHDKIYAFFRWCITEQALEEFRNGDLFSGFGWREGTASPEATAIEMGKTGIVVHLLRGEGMVAPIVQQDQAFGGSILVFSYPESVHAEVWGLQEVWGPHGRVPPTLLSGSFGALESASSMALPADASVAEIATRIAGISNLSDGDLAQLFGVARETFQRWRTGELTKPTRANRRRLGLLLRLLADLDRREVQVSEWLRNVTVIDDLTPNLGYPREYRRAGRPVIGWSSDCTRPHLSSTSPAATTPSQPPTC